MLKEIIELKKIYYKLWDDISDYEKLNDLGVLPEECTPFWNETVALKEKLGALIEEFERDQDD